MKNNLKSNLLNWGKEKINFLVKEVKKSTIY